MIISTQQTYGYKLQIIRQIRAIKTNKRNRSLVDGPHRKLDSFQQDLISSVALLSTTHTLLIFFSFSASVRAYPPTDSCDMHRIRFLAYHRLRCRIRNPKRLVYLDTLIIEQFPRENIFMFNTSPQFISHILYASKEVYPRKTNDHISLSSNISYRTLGHGRSTNTYIYTWRLAPTCMLR